MHPHHFPYLNIILHNSSSHFIILHHPSSFFIILYHVSSPFVIFQISAFSTNTHQSYSAFVMRHHLRTSTLRTSPEYGYLNMGSSQWSRNRSGLCGWFIDSAEVNRLRWTYLCGTLRPPVDGPVQWSTCPRSVDDNPRVRRSGKRRICINCRRGSGKRGIRRLHSENRMMHATVLPPLHYK